MNFDIEFCFFIIIDIEILLIIIYNINYNYENLFKSYHRTKDPINTFFSILINYLINQIYL